MKRYIQLRDYAKNHSVTYRTAWNRFHAGKIPNSFKDANNNIIIEVTNENSIDLSKVAIYTRVSSNENRGNLNTQAKRLKEYSIARGYQIVEVVNLAEDEKSDLMQDLVSIIYSFNTKMYGLRRSKRKTEEIVKLLEKDTKNAKNI